MQGIRIDGRGGQGAVLASKILAQAFYDQGYSIQAFPAFGMERRGAPVSAYVRIDEQPILRRGKIQQAETVIVLDPALLEMIDVTQGLAKGGLLLLNHTQSPDALGLEGDFHTATVDATKIALSHGLGSASSPIVNTVVLGALSSLFDNLSLTNVLAAIEQYTPVKAQANMEAARQAHEAVLRGEN
jgi:pyruvate ferredoxin oxidoreductase gamma subunit/2-oxoisovalerate ferredoxin oxidoreductase gamma subunit